MWSILAADWQKMKRTPIRGLTLLGPTGVIAMEAVNFHLRMEWLIMPGSDQWGILLRNVVGLMIPALLLGLALLPSLLVGLEHQAHAWKQLLALPVSRFQVYAGKFIWIAVLLAFAALLTGAGTGLLGWELGFTDPMPWGLVFKSVLYPYLAALPLVGLQLWLSAIVQNQAVAITVGIVGMIVGYSSMLLPGWMIWSYPVLAMPLGTTTQAGNPLDYVQYGVMYGVLLLAVGALHFTRRDVH